MGASLASQAQGKAMMQIELMTARQLLAACEQELTALKKAKK